MVVAEISERRNIVQIIKSDEVGQTPNKGSILMTHKRGESKNWDQLMDSALPKIDGEDADD